MADKADETTASAPGKHEQAEAPAAQQHPALAGDKAGEVEARSADGSEGLTFRKVFVIAGPSAVDGDHRSHDDNALRTLEEAIQRGLHPKGEARLVGTEVVDESRRGVISTACAYEVDVEPAVTDTEAPATVTPTTVLDDRVDQARKTPKPSE